MKRHIVLLVVCIALEAGILGAKGNQPQWKILQVKHFTEASGADFSKIEMGSFYESLCKRLQKNKVASQIVEEDGHG